MTNNLHLAAWFYYRKATEFSIQMRKVLQAEWYWERVEAQFRTTLHTHGCLKMRNDNELLQNTHKALLGKLAQERVEHLRNGSSIEPTVAPLLPENTFAEHLTANAKLKMNDTIREVLKNFIADYATHKKRNFCYYYGVAFEQDNENLEKVLSGKQEKQTCKKQGMLEPEILHVINDLDPIDAYTIESEVITYLQLYANKNTLNKSAVFGLGNRPRNWRNLKCTLTLLRGTYRATRYRAYPELDDLFDSCKTDRQLIIELNKFILDGKRAEDEVCRFVDYFISTMNPLYSDDNDEAIPNLPYFDRQRCCTEHPCAQAYRNPFDYVVKPNGPTLEALRNADFGKLVARTQRPHDCSKGGCRRVDRKSKYF